MAQPTNFKMNKNRGIISEYGILNGGKGSGYWHHKGRPGKIGGSGKGTGGISKIDEATFELEKKGLDFTFAGNKEAKPRTVAQFMAWKKEQAKLAKESQKGMKTAQEMFEERKKEIMKKREASLKDIDPADRDCYMETGYTPSEYQKKFKRAWNE